MVAAVEMGNDTGVGLVEISGKFKVWDEEVVSTGGLGVESVGKTIRAFRQFQSH